MKRRLYNSANKSLVIRLSIMACAMFAFGFLLVPIYDVFCDITGLGGKTNSAPAVVTSVETSVSDREITVEFTGSVNQYAPWDFHPNVSSMVVRPGDLYDTTFFARNLTDRSIVGQAVPSVAPGTAARYFRKTECFCFTAQDFLPGESRSLPVQFVVDADLPEHIDRITLSYTFFVSSRIVATSNINVN